MKNLFIISDIHGCFSMLEELLTHWDPRTEVLVVCGDMIDRGPNSKQVVLKLKKLQEQYPEDVILLQGNHESLFLEYLKDKDHITAQSCGALSTIASFLDKERPSVFGLDTVEFMDADVDEFKRSYADIAAFFKGLRLFYEHGNYVMVHAGVDLYLGDWKNTSIDRMQWSRDMAYLQNDTGKVFIFGHTPVHHFHKEKGKSTIWTSPCKTKIAIDGGAAFDGTLNGLKININTGEFTEINIKNNEN